jgi:hypothetical protein
MQEQLLRANPTDPEVQRRLALTHHHLFALQGCSQLTLLTHKAVQDELLLTSDQMRQIADLSEQLADQRRQFRDAPPTSPEERRISFEALSQANKKKVSEILRPAQASRLKQIGHQVRGPYAFREKEISEALALTGEQKERISEILSEGWTGPGGRERGRKRPEDFRKRAAERILGLLTPEQLEKWDALVGAPLKEEVRFGPPDLPEPPWRKGR